MVVRIPTHAIARVQMVQALMGIRHKWEEVANGDSLIEVDTRVGLLLYDIAASLALTNEEMSLALGDLIDEVD